MDQMDISGSLEDLQDQNVIVYLLRVFRNKYYSKVRARATTALCVCVVGGGGWREKRACRAFGEADRGAGRGPGELGAPRGAGLWGAWLRWRALAGLEP